MMNPIKKLESVISQYNQFYKNVNKQVYTFGDVSLFPSEIQTLVIIRRNPNYNLTDISKELKITKGALSKTISKIVNKGLINQYKKDGNTKNVYYVLTKKGLDICSVHDKVHQTFNISPSDEFLYFCEKNSVVLSEFMELYSDYIKDLDDLLKIKIWEKQI